MDILTIERDFTGWLAEKLNLVVDSTIFRGSIPEGFRDGVGVIFGSEIKSGGFYGFRPKSYNVQIFAKCESRDSALVLMSALTGMFPCNEFYFGRTRFLYVTAKSNTEPYESDDAGKVKNFISFNVVVSVLTNGAQIV